MDKPIVFTEHARKRVEERFSDFGVKNAERLLRSAEKYTAPNGKIYYQTKGYTFICREKPSRIIVITFIKHDK